MAIHFITPSIFLLKSLAAGANCPPHLHYQTVSHGRSCPPRHQSSTACSRWGGSPEQWCSSGLAPAHWTPLCEAQSSWSHVGWRRWWTAWRDLEAKKLDPQSVSVSTQKISESRLKIIPVLVLDQNTNSHCCLGDISPPSVSWTVQSLILAILQHKQKNTSALNLKPKGNSSVCR